jgi:hypothetical protein
MLVADAAEAAVLTVFAASVLSVAVLTVLDKWWRDALTASIVALDGMLGLTVAPSVLHYAFGLSLANAGFAWFDVAALFAVAVVTLWRTVVMAQIQVRARAERRRGRDDAPGPDGP